ncbi:MAG TPA: OsmC family protein [Longimicrobiaceae bacterium]|nr:OsmC family protein [Longimicrobiaceae bacterium]
MAVEITGSYTGKLKMELTHGPSGAVIRTDAPKDNQGDGSSFSPTDLLAAALGSCAVTTMAIVAAREGISFGEASFRIEKHMRSDPRRVARLPLTIRMPSDLDTGQRHRLEQIARGCPVARSLSPEVEVEMEFEYR